MIHSVCKNEKLRHLRMVWPTWMIQGVTANDLTRFSSCFSHFSIMLWPLSRIYQHYDGDRPYGSTMGHIFIWTNINSCRCLGWEISQFSNNTFNSGNIVGLRVVVGVGEVNMAGRR